MRVLIQKDDGSRQWYIAVEADSGKIYRLLHVGCQTVAEVAKLLVEELSLGDMGVMSRN